MSNILKVKINDTWAGIQSVQGEPGGVTESVKEALLNALEHVTYVDGHGRDYYNALYDALYYSVWSVTNTLSGCITTNTATTVQKNGSYTATFLPLTGYTITGASVTVLMGEDDITASVYSNGAISVQTVTAPLRIIVTAATLPVDSITAVFTQGANEIYPDDSLNYLKQYLVVTAYFSDNTSQVLNANEYELLGTLELGTSTITASFSSETDTFDVTVTQWAYESTGLIMWLDGEKNGVSGAHETTLTTWVDQSGNGWDWTNYGATVKAKSIVIDNSDHLDREYNSLPQNVAMMEIVYKTTNNDGGIILSGFGDSVPGNIQSKLNKAGVSFHTGSSQSENYTMLKDASKVHTYCSARYIDKESVSAEKWTTGWQYKYPCIGHYRGSNGSGSTYQFNGEIFAIRLYSSVLTETQIKHNQDIDMRRFGIGG